jgi:multidrug efflux pump subunit AcrA (membrane-fusion protein)
MNIVAGVLVTLMMAAQQAAPARTGAVAEVVFSDFVVTPIEDVRVPAREAGVLTELTAKKGTEVKLGDPLGRIDDSDAQARKLIAENEFKGAKTEADSDANVKAAEATVGVAWEEYLGSKKIREKEPQAISEFEVRRQLLTHEKSQFQADMAKVELAIAQLTRDAKAAQLQAVENEISRRIVVAPLAGVIVEKYRSVGEWAQAGEPLFRVVQMDRLRVEGMVKASEFMVKSLEGCAAKVLVSTPDGYEEFDAVIDFASPVVDASGEFLIHADFENSRKPNGEWRARPGLDAKIRVQVMQLPASSARDQKQPR